jgi:outer membrane protein
MKTLSLIIFFISFLAYIIPSSAQEPWSLDKCVNYAVEHNIQVKQKVIQSKSSEYTLQQSKAGLLPSVNASAQDGWQFGRSIDPYTNAFTEANVNTVSMSVNANLTIFKGLQQYNTIRQDNYTLLASQQDLEDTKYNITLMVASSYLQILFDMELLEVAKNQQAITQSQVDRTKILVDAGSLAQGNLLEIQSQLANEELQKINAENNLKTSYLSLTQLLELDTTADFKIQVPVLADPSEAIVVDSVKKIFEASQDLPVIKKQEYNLKSSEETLKISRGGLSPQLFVSASYGTGYSDARNKYDYVPGEPRTIGYVGTNGDPVLTESLNTITKPYAFADQINDNRSFSFSIGVQIPIFNRFTTKTRISQSKLSVENSKYTLDLTKRQLYKDIQSARNSAESALAKFKASQKALTAQQESFSYTQQKFDLGLVNSVDYNTAKNLLTKTQSDMVQAKFDFIFRINILNFYQGIPIKL